MDYETLLEFIKEPGYRTKAEIFKKFPEDKEALQMYLGFLFDKNIIGKTKYASPTGIGEIYYVIDKS